ncbi:hypothetical protein HPB48_000833 [Haemaphysalis longicornis]|uniref:Uncharacterized protein n=1 Tax=Haemaphysalis longicornis TaxID=44386 RepID=A0A9J6FMM2_HAELO|nr:hypothetical protein HPB48_000833 [Haemaphysalis longicornis]
MNAFCGHMRACLMIRSEVEKIESVQQLVKRPHTTPHMWLGTSYVAMVEHSTNPDLQQIGRVVRERGTAVPASALYGEPLLRRVVQGRAAVISDGTSLAFRVSSVCQAFAGAEFYLAREGVVSHPLNSFARKDIDPLIFKDINKVYVYLQSILGLKQQHIKRTHALRITIIIYNRSTAGRSPPPSTS